MNLPLISLPVQVPETLPLLLHPAVVHFAVVLPLVILIIELINLFTKRKSLTVSVYALFVLLVVVYVAAYMTGVTDGREAGPLLNDEGVAALKEHKLLGIYLIYFALLPVALKVMSVFVNKGWSRALYSVALVALVAFTFYQGKEGGELVYEHGANVASQQLLEDKLEELEFDLEDCQEQVAESEEDSESVSDANATSADGNVTIVLPQTADANVSKLEPVVDNVSAKTVKTDVNSTKNSEVNSSK
ncbi:MAG: DUF2231 domain-containing protein [Campylobacterota bacterium]